LPILRKLSHLSLHWHLDVELPYRLTDLNGDARPEFIYRQLGECTLDTLDGMVLQDLEKMKIKPKKN